jgi:hypothetical protein
LTYRFAILLLLVHAAAFPQRRVDPKNTYTRLICVVPIIGQGTAADPKRPQYAPLSRTSVTAQQSPIIGFFQQPSDDGKYALVEFIARDRSAFAAILADKQVKSFTKGKDKKEDIEKELKGYKKDFDLEKFGLVMP